MSQRALGTWLFGKMPSLGDFVSRGLDQSMRDRIDIWLSEEMEAARAKQGERFNDLYDYAPAWNFVDCASDGRWSGGALCASQDKAGRRYPLVMAAAASDMTEAAALSAGCLTAMCHAFAEGRDADGLASATIIPEDTGWQPQGPEWAVLAEGGPALIYPGSFPQGVITAMVELAQ